MNLKFLRSVLMAAFLVTTTVCNAGDIFINTSPTDKSTRLWQRRNYDYP